jgi:hypothetical protein
VTGTIPGTFGGGSVIKSGLRAQFIGDLGPVKRLG